MSDLAETPTSRLWSAESPDHGSVVLKILKPYGADEIHGVHLMQAMAGQGAAMIFAVAGEAILMEHLPGPPLSDLVRQHRDVEATEILATTAAQIRAAQVSPGLVPLDHHMRAIFATDDLAFPGLARAKHLMRSLLDTTPAIRPLHGDLHHDNILNSPRGWLAIDPKGLIGDPAYEFANSFRNPFDCQPLARNPERIQYLAKLYASSTDMPAARILCWAAAHCAISLCWDIQAGNPLDDDLALLPLLFAAAKVD